MDLKDYAIGNSNPDRLRRPTFALNFSAVEQAKISY